MLFDSKMQAQTKILDDKIQAQTKQIEKRIEAISINKMKETIDITSKYSLQKRIDLK